MSAQLMLFETDSEPQKDGSLVVRPRRLCTGQEVSARKAAELLGFVDVDTISRLVAIGEIRGWKPESKRGNAKWRIDLQSVLEYKARRLDLSSR
jgi:excisionase family DNA binding protein